MQADRRLVEHIEHAGQARADLRGEPDALALAARQRAGRARQRQIVEPDVAQEDEAVADLLQDAMGDLVALGVELLRQPLGPVDRRLDREQADFADVLAVDLDRQRLGLQAEAVAGLARRRAHVALDLLARPLALGLLVAALEVGDDALERLSHLVRAQAVVVGEADLLGPRAVEDRVARRLGQLAPRPVEPELDSACRARRASEGNRASSISPRARSRRASASLSGPERRATDRRATPSRARRRPGRRRAGC